MNQCGSKTKEFIKKICYSESCSRTHYFIRIWIDWSNWWFTSFLVCQLWSKNCSGNTDWIGICDEWFVETQRKGQQNYFETEWMKEERFWKVRTKVSSFSMIYIHDTFVMTIDRLHNAGDFTSNFRYGRQKRLSGHISVWGFRDWIVWVEVSGNILFLWFSISILSEYHIRCQDSALRLCHISGRCLMGESPARNSGQMSRKCLNALKDKNLLRIVAVRNSVIFEHFFSQMSMSIAFLVQKETRLCTSGRTMETNMPLVL
jgi:hypothetical protein